MLDEGFSIYATYFCIWLRPFFCVSGVKPEVSAVKFILHDVNVNWTAAKSRCEALGQRLAVIDTEDKAYCTEGTSVSWDLNTFVKYLCNLVTMKI